jgi:cytochrome P450
MLNAATLPLSTTSNLIVPPPRAQGIPIVGLPLALIRSPVDFLLEARETYGDVYAVKLGASETVILNHPGHAQHVLRDRASSYVKGGPLWDSVRTLLGNGLPVSEGDFWRRQRRMMQPQFHRDRIAAMADHMVFAIDDCMSGWAAAASSGTEIDIAREMTRITMRVIVRTMFGSDLTRAEVDSVGEHMTYILDFMLKGMLLSAVPAWVPMPGRRRYQASIKAVDEVIFRVIERRRDTQGVSGSLIEMLLDRVDVETGARMTPRELRDEAVSMFLAGYETTSSALAFAVDYLTRDAQAAAALAKETDAALGDRAPGFTDLRRLPQALWTFQEALRLAPSAYWLPRVATEDDVIDGYAIKAGTVVAPCLYTIHRHPDVWEEPDRFDPSRFSPSRVAARHGLAWMPFGAGQRQCIAKEFALMEGQLVLAMLSQRYRVAAAPGRAVKAQLSTTLRPKDGVWVRLGARSKGSGTSRGRGRHLDAGRSWNTHARSGAASILGGRDRPRARCRRGP